MPGPERRQVSLFYSYSHKDERLRARLEVHLSPLKREGVIEGWNDRAIDAGGEWAEEIGEHLELAGIILLLVSADFIASEYCWGNELARALERHKEGEACVVPIIVKPVDWTGAPFARLQALPKDGKPVTLWNNREAAWLDVAKGIRKVAEKLAAGLPLETSSPAGASIGQLMWRRL